MSSATDSNMPPPPPSDRTRLRRGANRADYDPATVREILDAAWLCHVAYSTPDGPAVIPTAHWRMGDDVYWHGHAAGAMIKAASAGEPVCFTASILDGLLLARSGFRHSFNYRSVIAYGHPVAITDPDEKKAALDAMIEKFAPGRSADLRAPTAQEIKATGVVAMSLEEASAKLRSGPPNDLPEDLGTVAWAGEIPIHTVTGPPRPSPQIPEPVAPPAYLKAIRVNQ
jgi:hypothetical protein